MSTAAALGSIWKAHFYAAHQLLCPAVYLNQKHLLSTPASHSLVIRTFYSSSTSSSQISAPAAPLPCFSNFRSSASQFSLPIKPALRFQPSVQPFFPGSMSNASNGEENNEISPPDGEGAVTIPSAPADSDVDEMYESVPSIPVDVGDSNPWVN